MSYAVSLQVKHRQNALNRFFFSPPPSLFCLSGAAQMGFYFAQERWVEINDALAPLRL